MGRYVWSVCLGVLLLCGACGESGSHQSAQTGALVYVVRGPTERGGPTDLYQFSTWPEGIGSHGLWCPTWRGIEPCMWQSRDELRGHYVSLYGPECEDCCDWNDATSECGRWVSSLVGCNA